MESPSKLPSTADAVDARSKLPFVHRYYVFVKAHYFLFFSAFGILYPILNITLRSRGLSNTELSYFNIGIPFLVFFTNPLMSFIADLSRRYVLTFNCVLVIATIACTMIFLAPSVKSRNIQADMMYENKLGRVLEFCASQEVATKCASRTECGCSYQANCTLNPSDRRPNSPTETFFFTFSMNSKNIYKEVRDAPGIDRQRACGIEYRVPVDQDIAQYRRNLSFDPFPIQNRPARLAVCEITCSIAHYCHGSRYDDQTRYIVLYSILFVVGTNFLTNAIPLGVSIGFASLHRTDIFGKQRVWGTIGFGILAFSASRLYQLFETEFVYAIMFATTSIMCMLVTCFIRFEPKKINQSATVDENVAPNHNGDSYVKQKKKKKPRFQATVLFPLLKRIDVIVFLSLACIWGMSYAVLDPYLYLYIDEIAPCQSRSIVGWMSLVSAIAEVIALFFAGKVLKTLGTNLSSIIILLAFTVRFCGYYYIRQPYFLTFMETMHFFNFGILYVLILQKADSIAPPGLSGTLQSVALGMTFGLGRGIGLIVSSFIYTLLEQRLLFLIFAIFNLICAVIYGLYFLVTKQCAKKTAVDQPVPKVVIESDTKSNEEPLLVSSTEKKTDQQMPYDDKFEFAANSNSP